MSDYLQIFGIVFGVISAIITAIASCAHLGDAKAKETWVDWVALIYLIAFVSAFIALVIWLGNQ